jgi:glycosyltransferase involved in cell wall biosynthesis
VIPSSAVPDDALGDAVFTFSYETWDDAARRGLMRPPDRIAATLMEHTGVRRLLVANPARWAPAVLARRALRRDAPFPRLPGRWLAQPTRLTRPTDPADLDRLRARYRSYGLSLGRAVRRRGLDGPALVTTNPLVAAFAEPDWASRVTYFGRDDWASFPGRVRQWPAYRLAYERIAAEGIAVAAVSADILDRIAPTGPSLVVANGVDPAEWSGPAGPEPAMLAGITRPRATYVGTLDDRLDVQGLRALALACPGISVVLVGPLPDPELLDPLAGFPNVAVLPAVGRGDLVRILRHSDIGLVAHRRTDLTEAMSPLKAYEYLAAGLPVLSIDLPPMRGLGERVRLTSSVAGFATAADEILALGPADEDSRLEFVAANSWSRRHEPLIRLVFGIADH